MILNRPNALLNVWKSVEDDGDGEDGNDDDDNDDDDEDDDDDDDDGKRMGCM